MLQQLQNMEVIEFIYLIKNKIENISIYNKIYENVLVFT